ncbi:MAG: hypothetical protein AB2A00_43040, partial [Myxococcota bacterium]
VGGAWVALRATRGLPRGSFLVGAGTVTLLTGALGCVAMGAGGVLGMVLGAGLGVTPMLAVQHLRRA